VNIATTRLCSRHPGLKLRRGLRIAVWIAALAVSLALTLAAIVAAVEAVGVAPAFSVRTYSGVQPDTTC
jgi:hypothetical protein